jgi:hypothetical protein
MLPPRRNCNLAQVNPDCRPDPWAVEGGRSKRWLVLPRRTAGLGESDRDVYGHREVVHRTVYRGHVSVNGARAGLTPHQVARGNDVTPLLSVAPVTALHKCRFRRSTSDQGILGSSVLQPKELKTIVHS